MFIATQDRALRASLGRIPGAALIFASVNGLHLEAPSAEQVADARAALAAQLGIKPAERKVRLILACQSTLAPLCVKKSKVETGMHVQTGLTLITVFGKQKTSVIL